MSIFSDPGMRRRLSLAAVSLSLLLSGCQTTSRAQTGAIVGSGLGAMTGAIIGSNSGHAGKGALIGAAAGALGGGLIGNAEDARAERDAAIAQAAYAQQTQQAVTNVDVIHLTQSGISEDVIISAMRSQGGRFDLSPQGIINLKNSGVSDRVILAMQNFDHLTPTPVTTIVHEPPAHVIVVPRAPAAHFSFGSRPHYRDYGHW